jgi:hypothetical protein
MAFPFLEFGFFGRGNVGTDCRLIMYYPDDYLNKKGRRSKARSDKVATLVANAAMGKVDGVVFDFTELGRVSSKFRTMHIASLYERGEAFAFPWTPEAKKGNATVRPLDPEGVKLIPVYKGNTIKAKLEGWSESNDALTVTHERPRAAIRLWLYSKDKPLAASVYLTTIVESTSNYAHQSALEVRNRRALAFFPEYASSNFERFTDWFYEASDIDLSMLNRLEIEKRAALSFLLSKEGVEDSEQSLKYKPKFTTLHLELMRAFESGLQVGLQWREAEEQKTTRPLAEKHLLKVPQGSLGGHLGMPARRQKEEAWLIPARAIYQGVAKKHPGLSHRRISELVAEKLEKMDISVKPDTIRRKQSLKKCS